MPLLFCSHFGNKTRKPQARRVAGGQSEGHEDWTARHPESKGCKPAQRAVRIGDSVARNRRYGQGAEGKAVRPRSGRKPTESPLQAPVFAKRSITGLILQAKGTPMVDYFSSASMRKGKRTGLGGYEQEQTRTMGEGQEAWANPNIDPTHPHAVDVVYNEHGGSVKDATLARLEQRANADRKLRKDAVTHLTGYFSMPDYSRRTVGERHEFEKRVHAFLSDKYGAENVVDMRWHFDESSPHLHATVVPITEDGRLCAKEMFAPTKRSMEQWQRDYYAAVAEPMGYKQPDFGRSSEKGYTQETRATREQLRQVEAERDKVAQEAQEARQEAEKARQELARVRGEKAALEVECDALKAENKALEAAVEDAHNMLAHIVDGLANVLDCWHVGNNVREYAQGVVENLDRLLERVGGWYEEREQARAAREAAVTEKRSGLFGRKTERTIDVDKGMAAAVGKACEQLGGLADRLKQAQVASIANERPHGNRGVIERSR